MLNTYRVKINKLKDVKIKARNIEIVAAKYKKLYNNLNFVVCENCEKATQKIYGFNGQNETSLIIEIRQLKNVF